MRIPMLVLLAAALTSALASGTPLPGDPPRKDLVRIELVSPAQARDLDRLGVVVNDVRSDFCVAEATPELVQRLGALGYHVTTLTENITGVYQRNSLTRAVDGRYLTYQEYVDTMNAMATGNPGICRLETLALSAAGNQVLVMKVSAHPGIEDTLPQVYFEANVHGDEKIGWAVAFEFLKYLVGRYGTDSQVTNLVNSRAIWINPMLNPDGYISGYRENGHSVDMNRNWGWMWGEEIEPGSSAMSESEIAGDARLLWQHPFVTFVSYHAGTECIPYPWSYTDYDTIPERHAIDWLSAGYSARGNGYQYGQGSVVMYYINGSSKDFGYGTLGEMSWSIEVNYTKTPPASEIDTTFRRNRDAMLFFCHAAGLGIHGLVTDSATGQPLHAQVWLEPADWPGYTNPANGVFHRFCLPGTYSLVFACPGYETKRVDSIVVTATDSSVSLHVQLAPRADAPLFGFQVTACSAVTITANRTYPVRALGLHDSSGFEVDNNRWIVVDMERPIHNGPGNDFSVFLTSGSAAIKAANDWAGPWTTVGSASSPSTDFDLGATGLDSARYIMVQAAGSCVLDAIEGVQNSGVSERRPQGPLRSPQTASLSVIPAVVSQSANIVCTPPPEGDLLLGIYDAQGRRLTTIRLAAGIGQVGLLTRTPAGRMLGNGVYFVRPLSAPEAAIRARFAVAR